MHTVYVIKDKETGMYVGAFGNLTTRRKDALRYDDAHHAWAEIRTMENLGLNPLCNLKVFELIG